jgi:lysophospholipase L1-like esterase
MNSDRVFELIVPLLRGTATRTRQDRRDSFRAEPVPPQAVVFLGDSITQVAPLGEMFPDIPAVNRGIGWDTSEDLLTRLDEAIDHPAAISLLIGTNDLHTSRRLRDPGGIALRLDAIINRIQTIAPGTPVLVNGLLPRTAWYAPRLRALNERYRAIAERSGNQYVDAWPALADPSGAIRKEYTTDNLHLTQPGYLAWSDVLRPLLTPYAS